MDLAALVLTTTHPWLVWLLWRHGERTVAPAYRLALLLGLVLTFVLGASAGMLLGGQQPPAVMVLPVVGRPLVGVANGGTSRPTPPTGAKVSGCPPAPQSTLFFTTKGVSKFFTRHDRLADQSLSVHAYEHTKCLSFFTFFSTIEAGTKCV